MYPEKCPEHPKADGPLVGKHRAKGGGFEHRVQCPDCESDAGTWRTTRDGAIVAWNERQARRRGELGEGESR